MLFQLTPRALRQLQVQVALLLTLRLHPDFPTRNGGVQWYAFQCTGRYVYPLHITRVRPLYIFALNKLWSVRQST